MVISCVLFGFSVFFVFYAMVGYPLLLMLLDKFIKPPKLKIDNTLEPTVSYMIVAHNEEKIIKEKLMNALELDYPKEKIDIVVASDNSTDSTNLIVEDFIKKHPYSKIRLVCSKEHKGKTNAQNETQKTVKSEILVMTDANTMLKSNAIKELVKRFTSDDIAYVCGKLVYENDISTNTSDSESTYWDLDLKMRDIESRIFSITAGNGAIYACRNRDYVDFEPIKCHDISMPYYYSVNRKRAIFVPEAIAMEKAGETNEDEFKRKVRMNRDILDLIIDGIKVLNVFKYKWFSVFYFGHRTCRYTLWLWHLIALVSSLVMACIGSYIGISILFGQIVAIVLTVMQLKRSFNNKFLRLIGYYGMTVLAQYMAIFKIIAGTAKPIWDKAESTR